MRRPTLCALALGAALIAGATAFACADNGDSPVWVLAKDQYDPSGNSAMLTPGNDTRVNLLLLLADRRATPVRDPAVKAEGPPLVLFPWAVMAAAAVPQTGEPAAWGVQQGSRCQSNTAGAAAFIAAVRANRQVSDGDKQRLAAARASFVPDCSGKRIRPAGSDLSSPAAKAFEAYLSGADDFYRGDFEAAGRTFAGLADAPDAWLRETGAYMLARTRLNRAQEGAFDEYGGLAAPEKRDGKAIAAAGSEFQAYLSVYPQGRYASSARGLTRRVAWLADNRQELAAEFDRQVARAGGFDGPATDAGLVNEIDLKLLAGDGPKEVRHPVLLAIVDLARMRCVESYETPDVPCRRSIGRDELARQAPLFVRERPLFDYLRAAEAFWVRKQPREVLALIPDAAGTPRFTYLEFSRQALRGLALEATGDGNARAFWLSLFAGATQPYQRQALELALASFDEGTGKIDRIFAPDSRVTHPVMRQMLLEQVAGPDLLRRQASAVGVPRQEREVALYTLLAKQLRRGFYRGFLGDVKRVPPGAPLEGDSPSAHYYDARFGATLDPPPLGRFGPAARLGDAGCPTLAVTVGQLAGAPDAIRPRLCLAEFFRGNDFDRFEDRRIERATGLAGSPPQFPGKPYQRLEVYKAVIADRRAADDDRALALNRAVRCYGPAGGNSCGGIEVAPEQRRAWFERLKRDYPNSRWAKSLRYFW